mgnify:CR=1 FL=1
MKCKVVVFKDGRRIEKTYDDHKEAQGIVKRLAVKGIKVRLITCTAIRKFYYPPEDDNLYCRTIGMLWCTYCRDWSYFKVPRFKQGTVIGTLDWFMNTFHRQGIPVCAWCYVPDNDYYVMKANATWETQYRKPRRRKRKVRN